MDRFLPLASFLLLSAVATHAALPAKVYWHTVLPNTPMPSAIQALLQPDAMIDEKTGTSVNVGKGGVNVNAGHGGTNVNVGHGGVNVNTGYKKPGSGTNVNVGHGGVNVNTGYKKPGGDTNVNVGHGGVNVHTGYHKPGGGTHVYVGNGSPFSYIYAATETQIHDDPRVTLFFLEKNLHPGAKMTLHFTTSTTTSAAFIPRRVADSLPFTSSKAPEILDRFSVQPGSIEAESMKQTLLECEEPAVGAESKLCATSLESMVDFSTASLGTREVIATSTTVGKGADVEQEYTMGAAKKMAGSELVACHVEAYAYAVFYCHATRETRGYSVEMVGENGAKVEAVAVCHVDTAKWNPGHVAFKVLNVKPGSVPVCHFLPQDHVVWAPMK